MKVILYSAIYGGYDAPKSHSPLDIEAVVYTDDPELKVDGWETRYWPLPEIKTPMMQAKWWKTRPDLAVPEADISLWIDGSMTITHDDYVGKCLEALGDDDAVFVTHPWRDCIYVEGEYSMALERYKDADIRHQLESYRQRGHPEHWGLFATGANVRRHTETVFRLGKDWWWENETETWQDQISLPFLVRRFTHLKWNTNMPWHEWWHLGYHEWI